MDFPPVVRFDEFMARALYDPERGYYARRIRGIGAHGDFSTAAGLFPEFSVALAAWVVQAMRETGCRDLIEMGPGDGTLAEAVLRQLPWSWRWRVRLRFVEKSAPLAARQRERLRGRAIWHAHPSEALAACGGSAVLISNELVDAFPVRRFQLHDHGWRELFLRWQPPAPPDEVWQPVAAPPPSSSWQQEQRVGQWIEVHDSYREWLAEWLPAWRGGRMLTIDYGATAGALYHRRPRGTLRGYLMHQRLEGAECYQNPGRIDLTADVNFTDLQNWAKPHARTIRLASLRDWVLSHAPSAGNGTRAWLAPEGAGGAFLALEQEPLSGEAPSQTEDGRQKDKRPENLA